MHRYKFSYTSEIDTSNETADIHIYGVIGWDEGMFGEGEGTDNRAFALVKLMKSLDKKVKRLNVHINSPGGSISDGLAIYNTMKQLNADVHTYNSGLVASMASIIMMAGTTHFPKASLFHLHNAHTVIIGNQIDLLEEAAILKKFDDTLKSIIMEKSGKDEQFINQYFDGKDHFFTSEEAKELGVVDVHEKEQEANTPQPAQNIKNMTAQQLFDLYTDQEKQQSSPAAWLQGLKNSIFPKAPQNHTKPNTHTSNHKPDTMKAFKAAAHVIAALAISSLELNEEGQTNLSVDQIMALDQTIKDAQDEMQTEKTAKEQAEKQVTELQEEVKNLKEKLNKAPGDDPQNPKGEDPKGNQNGIVPVDAELRKAMLFDD